MRFSTYIRGKSRASYAASLLVLSCSLMLAGCTRYPVDAHEICLGALQGTPTYFNKRDPNYDKCFKDVTRQSYVAAHKAAEPYRMLPR